MLRSPVTTPTGGSASTGGRVGWLAYNSYPYPNPTPNPNPNPNQLPRLAIVFFKRPFLRAVARLRHLDIYWRFIFPMVYVPYLIWSVTKHDGAATTRVLWHDLIKDAASRAGCD